MCNVMRCCLIHHAPVGIEIMSSDTDELLGKLDVNTTDMQLISNGLAWPR